MKTLIIILLSLTSTFIFAQNTVTWVGGTPGKETKWNEAKNWSDHHIPDEFSFVIIKQYNSGHNAQPVLMENAEVASIEIHSGASLTINENGALLIDGSDIDTEGIVNYNGRLINNGLINMKNLVGFLSENFNESIEGKGLILIDEEILQDTYLVKE